MPNKPWTFKRWQVIGVFVLLILSFVVTLALWKNQNDKLNHEIQTVAKVAQENNRALCLRKSDAKESLAQAKLFLSEHPHGTADFSLKLIHRSIAQAQDALGSLKDVRCPAKPPLQKETQ